jgi:hypothetical protein
MATAPQIVFIFGYRLQARTASFSKSLDPEFNLGKVAAGPLTMQRDI